MTSFIFFLIFIPVLAIILLVINFALAQHKPDKNKDAQFECGFSSFIQMSRQPFVISFFIYALLFLLFDLEILLIYPYVITAYNNSMYGLIVMQIFFVLLTIGFIFELGKKALYIESRQNQNRFKFTRGSGRKYKKEEMDLHIYSLLGSSWRWLLGLLGLGLGWGWTSGCFTYLTSLINVISIKIQTTLELVWKNLKQEVGSLGDTIKDKGLIRGLLHILLIFILVALYIVFMPVAHCDSDTEQTEDSIGKDVTVKTRKRDNPEPEYRDELYEVESKEDSNKNKDNYTNQPQAIKRRRIEYSPGLHNPINPNWESELMAQKEFEKSFGINSDSESEEDVNKTDKVHPLVLAKLRSLLNLDENNKPKLSVNAFLKTRLADEYPIEKPQKPVVVNEELAQKIFEQDMKEALKKSKREEVYDQSKIGESSANGAIGKYGQSSDNVEQDVESSNNAEKYVESSNNLKKYVESSKYIGNNEYPSDSEETSVYSSANSRDSPDTYHKKMELLQQDEVLKQQQRNRYEDDDQ